jgi:hypothetical protein
LRWARYGGRPKRRRHRAEEREVLAHEQAERAEHERTDAEESLRRADEVDSDVNT